MSDLSDWRHLSASEFPNDNPALHDGAIWVCFAPCGPLRPVVRPRAGGRPSTIPAPLESVTEVRLAALADNDACRRHSSLPPPTLFVRLICQTTPRRPRLLAIAGPKPPATAETAVSFWTRAT
jgi:hypothetical protein